MYLHDIDMQSTRKEGKIKCKSPLEDSSLLECNCQLVVSDMLKTVVPHLQDQTDMSDPENEGTVLL